MSVASGVDAVFSLLPTWWLAYKIEFEILIIVILIVLNLRGMKESIRVLIPLFIGFLITHLVVIVSGILFR